MPRAVVDTTVLVSACLTPRGPAAEVLARASSGAFELHLAREIIEELRTRLLHRRHIRRRYAYSDAWVNERCAALAAAAEMVAALPDVRVVTRDPNDDMIIACALAAKADYVVTRDKDLLSLGAHQGIRIVTPRQFLDLLDASP